MQILLTLLPIIIIGLILLQKTNSGMQGSDLKAPLSPLTLRLQQSIIFFLIFFLGFSIYSSNKMQQDIVVKQQIKPITIPTQDPKLNSSFSDLIEK